MADLVFNDAEALADLNAIVHPAVGAEIADRMAALAETDEIVVLDVPLLVESKNAYPVAGLLVVDVDPEVAVRRLVEHRGMPRGRRPGPHGPPGDPRADRLARADRVIDNSGTPDALASQIDGAWVWIESLRPAA